MSFLFLKIQDEFILWMETLGLGAVFVLSAIMLLRYAVPCLKTGGHIRAVYGLFRILCDTALMIIIAGSLMFISRFFPGYSREDIILPGQFWLYSERLVYMFCVLFLVWVYGMVKEFRLKSEKRRMLINVVRDCDVADDPEILDLYAKLGALLGLKQLPIFMTNSGWSGAFIESVRQPVIVVPYKLYGKDLSEIALCHELVHYKRHHLILRNVVDILNIIFWFLPYKTFLMEEVKILQETICDMECCEVMKNSITSLEYYSRIIKIVTMKRLISMDAILAQLVETHSDLMKRVQNIEYVQYGKRRYVLLGMVTVLMAVLFLVFVKVKILPPDPLRIHQIVYSELTM